MSRRALVFFIAFAALLALPSFVQASEPSGPQVIGGQSVDRLHLVFPQDPQLTWFLDTFGAGRAGGHVHIGNDLHAPKGSPVYAIAPGVVTRMAISGRAGAYLGVDHGSDWASWYMHLDNDDPGTDNGRGGFETAFAAGISEGSFVDAGQLIGFVGDSGNAEHTVPHTHFELHRNGRAIDPYLLLTQAHERALLAIEAERMAAVAARIV
ncbi:MAG: M23 family metallopeptidase [Acidimicrobiia bacterium]